MILNKKANTILNKIWMRQRKRDHRTYSLRKIAKTAGVSPGYLSKVLANKKPLNLKLAKSLIKALKVDQLSQTAILSGLEPPPASSSRPYRPESQIESYEIPSETSEWLLRKWYHLVLLDLMTTSDFQSRSEWIAKRLGITVHEINDALRNLVEGDLAVLDSQGNYQKKHKNIRFPTVISKTIIREHHKANLRQALDHLDKYTTPKDFNSRLILGLSIACNKDRLPEVKEFLHMAVYEAAKLLSEDPCTEVYQLNLQLFPQTK